MVVNNLPRSIKRLILFSNDLIIILACLFMAYALRYETLHIDSVLDGDWSIFPFMATMGAGLIFAFRLPHIKLLALDGWAILQIGTVAALLTLAALAASFLIDAPVPRSVPLIFGALFFLLAVCSRVFVLNLIWFLGTPGERVAIYGAGIAGIQLSSALRRSVEMKPVIFFDDNPNLHRLIIDGLPVHSPTRFLKMRKRYKFSKVLLAMPSVSENRRNTLITQLSKHRVEVQVIPSYIDLITNKGAHTKLRTFSTDHFLGRNKVDLNVPEIPKIYAERVILITGAGGSIGSELCRQLLDCRPARIVLFEQSELALYLIERELRPLAEARGTSVVARLGSVTDEIRVGTVIREEQVEIIIHAAAYKHVPLVEDNILEGARNNVLGTQIVADIAEAEGVERFILVSTDKAVRPTSIMGATKRMAELVVQDRQLRSRGTKFAIVRFGNVLGSSGSVLPMFQKQIEIGGPVTVTHPKVTRFFMTIPEAVRLVLLAGTYADGGDVFVLDMGKPQKIIDIARKMIELSGRTIKDPDTGEGDIAIEIIGLRPGEKLYEELLIDDGNLRKTPHAKILRAQENMISEIEVVMMLRELKHSIATACPDCLRTLIEYRVEGYDRHARKGAPPPEKFTGSGVNRPWIVGGSKP